MIAFLNTVAALILSSQMSAGAPASSSASLVTSHVNGSVALLAFDKREFRRTSLRRKHVAVAVSDLGDIVGVVLNKRGRALCELVGFYDGQCVVLSGCGASGVAC
jgi:hypothetical protein